MDYVKYEKINLKTHPELSEKWVQEIIANDPAILQLGDVILKDKERIQPRAGRLDILLQDESDRRYEVEIQLGATDESHIIRTIEYWDIERKRYPQYDHIAVIVAEDITSRFLNVISLFNGSIPMIAIQMNALKLGNQIGLHFTTVLNHVPLGLVDEDEAIQEPTDRAYWESKSSKKTLSIADELLLIARETDSDLEFNYTKFYIGVTKKGSPRNFMVLRPKTRFIRFEPRLTQSVETTQKIENAGLDLMDYDIRSGRYRIRLNPEDVSNHKEIIADLIRDASREG